MILAIDTATNQASLALLGDDAVLAELSWVSRGDHSRQLGDLLPRLLALAACEVKDLAGIAVASGPGSFNGIRVGMSLAKGLALARRIPLAGISTLDVIGYGAACADQSVCATLNAGRGELFIAWYEGAGPTWQRVSEHARMAIDAAAETYRPGAILAGDGALLLAEALAVRGAAPALPSAVARPRRAGYLAELGRQYFNAHGSDGLDELQPLYLRRSAAEEKRAASQGE
jgi:tRNA threonylcarbamoyladenosine biosynthesis protein TsaB